MTHVNSLSLTLTHLPLILNPDPTSSPLSAQRPAGQICDGFDDVLSSLRLQRASPNMSMDISKPIAFCEHLQLSAIGIQPASISFQVSLFASRTTLSRNSLLSARAIDSHIRVRPLHLRAGEGQRGQPGRNRRPRRCQQCPPETNHRRLGHYAPSSKDYCAEMCATRSILVDA